ncbi:MAG: acetate--CoA ligase family protein [Planctomycetota bacterium]
MLDALFKPKSIAVIGASNRPLTIGYRITQNLKDVGYKGPIYPVNPKDPAINGLKAYPSILQVPGDVDLAHIVVKNTMVPAVIEDCGKKGVKAVIINTAGFKEIGPDGIALEKQAVEMARKYKVRIFGPNCQGVMNSDPANPVYANFTFTKLKPGHISLLAQSGGVGEVINQRLYQLGIGIRMYASNGNAADVSIPEILEYWGKDDQTRVIILHIESLAQPEEFIRVAKEVSRRKPILGIKTGRTETGARAVASHTGSLMKADTAIEAVFDKCGIISFRNQDEICQAAIGFAMQPLPKGPNVGIITNTGGPAIIATDECIEGGLKIPDLDEPTRTYLKANLFPEASVNNPVDVLATAGPKEWSAAIESLMKAPNIDSILVNFVTPFFVDCEGVAREMARIAATAVNPVRDRSSGDDRSDRGDVLATGSNISNGVKPILCVTMTDKTQWANTLNILQEAGIPSYDLPETASKVLVAMTRYAELRQSNQATPERFKDADVKAVQQIIRSAESLPAEASAQAGVAKFLSSGQALGIIHTYKIPEAKYAICDKAEDALGSADYVGYPMVLKIDSVDVVHKTEQKGVVLNIASKEQLAGHLKDFEKRFKQGRYLMQEYLTGGKEVIIGAKYVEGLGHLLMFGLGGIFVEVLKDVAFKLAPLSKDEALRMVKSIKGYKILEGARGEKGVNLDKLAEILQRTGQLVTDNPQIKELDLNPVMLYSEADKCKVVDVRIRV